MTLHKAWRVTQHPLSDCKLYLLAPTANKAKAAVFRSEYNDDDWYLDYRVKRMPWLDFDDQAQPGDPHDEPLNFFNLWRHGYMRMDCAVCGTEIPRGSSTHWSNGWTVFCRDHWQDDEPFIRRTQDWYQPVDPNNPMIWIGDYS